MITNINIGLLTKTSLEAREKGKLFLNSLIDILPEWEPEKIGRTEPLRLLFSKDHIEEALNIWGDGFIWKRKNPSIEGSVCNNRKDIHDAIFITINKAKSYDPEKILKFFSVIDKLFHLEFAYAHLISSKELSDLNYYKSCTMPFQVMSTHQLKKYLPDICWMTVFGSAYIDLIGCDRLLSCPCQRIESFGSCVSIQLTKDIFDFNNSIQSARQAQMIAKNHLGQDLFYQQIKQVEYRTPHFALDKLN